MNQTAAPGSMGRVVVAGGTGFIGRALTERLLHDGHEVVVLTRSASAKSSQKLLRFGLWDARSEGPWKTLLEGASAVVNLSGESLGARRWSQKQKERIVGSRIRATAAIVNALKDLRRRPSVLVNGSAIGYYGDCGDRQITEESQKGIGFLADTAALWESEARRAEIEGVRLALVRSGVVLGRGAQVLGRLVLPFRLFIGGHLGSGDQWFPWIHIDDLVECILFAIRSENAAGAYNAVSPQPVTMKEFSKALGRAVHRPSWAPVPAFVLRLLLGEMSEMVLGGQRALPARLTRSGFRFRHESVHEALASILN